MVLFVQFHNIMNSYLIHHIFEDANMISLLSRLYNNNINKCLARHHQIFFQVQIKNHRIKTSP